MKNAWKPEVSVIMPKDGLARLKIFKNVIEQPGMLFFVEKDICPKPNSMLAGFGNFMHEALRGKDNGWITSTRRPGGLEYVLVRLGGRSALSIDRKPKKEGYESDALFRALLLAREGSCSISEMLAVRIPTSKPIPMKVRQKNPESVIREIVKALRIPEIRKLLMDAADAAIENIRRKN